MNDRMDTWMTEATRLTRAGRLVEATALIQRALRGMLASEASSNTTDRTTDQPIDVTFRVIDAAPRLADVSAQEWGHQTNSSAAATPPPPDVAVSPGEQVCIQPDTSEDQHSAAPSTTQPTGGSERAESRPAGLRWLARLRGTLSPRKGFGGPVSTLMSNRARSEIWAGGQFVDGSYGNHAGAGAYKLYIPSGYRGQALPLVVMLHGCTQTPEDFAAGTRMNVLAERELFFVVYPAQATSANQSKCWNWFKATDQRRGRGEPSIIAGITHHIVTTYHLNAQRVYVAGLSAGGAMASIMGVSYPDLYAAIGVHSGLAYGAAHDLPSALAAMQHGGTTAQQRDNRFQAAKTCVRAVPTIVFHGDRDTTVHPRNGDQVLAQWETADFGNGPGAVAGANLRVAVSLEQAPDGHAYTRSIYHDANGHTVMERWLIHGAGHGWSGGSPHGSFTDPEGPDASQEMVRFFYEHPGNESLPAADESDSTR